MEIICRLLSHSEVFFSICIFVWIILFFYYFLFFYFVGRVIIDVDVAVIIYFSLRVFFRSHQKKLQWIISLSYYIRLNSIRIRLSSFFIAIIIHTDVHIKQNYIKTPTNDSNKNRNKMGTHSRIEHYKVWYEKLRSVKFIKKNNEFGRWKCVKIYWQSKFVQFFFGNCEAGLETTSKLSSGRWLRRILEKKMMHYRDTNRKKECSSCLLCAAIHVADVDDTKHFGTDDITLQ